MFVYAQGCMTDAKIYLFTSFNLEFESGAHEASQLYSCSFPSSAIPLAFQYVVPMSDGAWVEGGPPAEYTVLFSFHADNKPRVRIFLIHYFNKCLMYSQSPAALRERSTKSEQRRFDGDHGARIPC